MRYLKLVILFALLSNCTPKHVEVDGTMHGANGGIVSVLDPLGATLFSTVIKGDKFVFKQLPIPEKGYYTLSIQSGDYPRDFDIYLEPGKYIIDVPNEEDQYLKIQTQSVTQQNLSAYYNLENALSKKIRRENAVWTAKIKDPASAQLTDAEFKTIMEHVEAGRRREHGLRIAAIDSFLKTTNNDIIVPHIISNVDYKADPTPYLMFYNKLSADAQNSAEGKLIGKELRSFSN